jgi:hypothetical protein
MRAEIAALREAMESRFDALNRSMLAMMGTMVVVLASTLGATQL